MLIDPGRARRLLACMGDPSRFRVVEKLMASPFCVTDLAREIGLSQSCTTRHLQVLQQEGLVAGLRDGKRVVFRLRTDEPMIAGLVTWALAHAGVGGNQDPVEAVPPDSSPPATPVDMPELAGMKTSATPEKVSRPSIEAGGTTPRPRGSSRADDIDDFLL